MFLDAGNKLKGPRDVGKLYGTK